MELCVRCAVHKDDVVCNRLCCKFRVGSQLGRQNTVNGRSISDNIPGFLWTLSMLSIFDTDERLSFKVDSCATGFSFVLTMVSIEVSVAVFSYVGSLGNSTTFLKTSFSESWINVVDVQLRVNADTVKSVPNIAIIADKKETIQDLDYLHVKLSEKWAQRST
jgi:hypothetical protein